MYFHVRHDYQNSLNYFDGFPLFDSSQQSVIFSLMFLLRKLKMVLLCATRSLCLICLPSACDGCSVLNMSLIVIMKAWLVGGTMGP